MTTQRDSMNSGLFNIEVESNVVFGNHPVAKDQQQVDAASAPKDAEHVMGADEGLAGSVTEQAVAQDDARTQTATHRMPQLGKGEADADTPKPKAQSREAHRFDPVEQGAKSAASTSRDKGTGAHTWQDQPKQFTAIDEPSVAGDASRGGAAHAPRPAEDAKQKGVGYYTASRKSTRIKLVAAVAAVVVIAAIAGVFVFGGGGQPSNADTAVASSSSSAQRASYSVSVEYVDLQTGQVLKDAQQRSITGNQADAIEAAQIQGYQLVSATDNGKTVLTHDDLLQGKQASVDVTAEQSQDHTIVFAYAKEVDVTVRYLEAGTDAELAPVKTLANMLSGDVVREQAVAIDGYTVSSDAQMTIVLTNESDKNVMTFYYTRDPQSQAQDEQSTQYQGQSSYYETPSPTYTEPATATPAPEPTSQPSSEPSPEPTPEPEPETPAPTVVIDDSSGSSATVNL